MKKTKDLKGKESRQNDNTKKPKLYPVPEEDSFIPPDDDSAEIKYETKCTDSEL